MLLWKNVQLYIPGNPHIFQLLYAITTRLLSVYIYIYCYLCYRCRYLILILFTVVAKRVYFPSCCGHGSVEAIASFPELNFHLIERAELHNYVFSLWPNLFTSATRQTAMSFLDSLHCCNTVRGRVQLLSKTLSAPELFSSAVLQVNQTVRGRTPRWSSR